MRIFIFVISVCFLVLSCQKKSDQQLAAPNLSGTWIWIASGDATTDKITNYASGIWKEISFTADGHVSISHNDSVQNDYQLQVTNSSLLNDTVSAVATYTISYVQSPCVELKYLSIVVNGAYTYPFLINGDTLQLFTFACSAPYSSKYLRKP